MCTWLVCPSTVDDRYVCSCSSPRAHRQVGLPQTRRRFPRLPWISGPRCSRSCSIWRWCSSPAWASRWRSLLFSPDIGGRIPLSDSRCNKNLSEVEPPDSLGKRPSETFVYFKGLDAGAEHLPSSRLRLRGGASVLGCQRGAPSRAL